MRRGSDRGQFPPVASEDPSVDRDAAIHLDTTVMLEQFKAGPRPSKVERNLEKFKFRSTSTYARHEYNRTWVKDMAYLYARAGQVAGIQELYGEVGRSFHGGQKNRMTRCLEILENGLAKYRDRCRLAMRFCDCASTFRLLF